MKVELRERTEETVRIYFETVRRQGLDRTLPQRAKTAEEAVSRGEDLGYENLPLANQTSYSLVKGVDDQNSPGGYAGRAGLYEAIDVDEDIQKLIVAHATAAEVMRVAKEKGTVTMRQDGFLKAVTGVTTIEEVNRVAGDLA